MTACHVYAVHELLVVGVVLLGLGKDLADEVDGSLDRVLLSVFLSLHNQDDADAAVGGSDVHEHGLPWSRRREHWRLGKCVLELEEGCVRLVGPREFARLLQQMVQGQGFFSQPADKPAERG